MTQPRLQLQPLSGALRDNDFEMTPRQGRLSTDSGLDQPDVGTTSSATEK